MNLPVYLDYSATTPTDPRVAEKMIPWLTGKFGNPASRSHAYGWAAEKAVEEARAEVAAYINADPREIVWTSGATEADNLAIKGAAHFYKDKGKHLITVKTEHKAVLDSMRHLETEGFEVKYELPKTVKAPLKVGDKVGKAYLVKDGVVIGEANVIIAQNIEKSTFIDDLRRIFGLHK